MCWLLNPLLHKRYGAILIAFNPSSLRKRSRAVGLVAPVASDAPLAGVVKSNPHEVDHLPAAAHPPRLKKIMPLRHPPVCTTVDLASPAARDPDPALGDQLPRGERAVDVPVQTEGLVEPEDPDPDPEPQEDPMLPGDPAPMQTAPVVHP